MIGNKCYNCPQASNHNRKQVESISWFLLLIDKQLTNTWYVSQCISPPLRGIIVYGISKEKRTKCKYVIGDKNQPTVLANSNHSRARRRNIKFECKQANGFLVNFTVCPSKANTWKLKSISCIRNETKQYTSNSYH